MRRLHPTRPYPTIVTEAFAGFTGGCGFEHLDRDVVEAHEKSCPSLRHTIHDPSHTISAWYVYHRAAWGPGGSRGKELDAFVAKDKVCAIPAT